MLFAFVNENKVIKIEDRESYESILDAHQYQAVINIDGVDPVPKVGWLFVDGALISDLKSITPRQLRLALMFAGVDLANIYAAIDMLPEPDRTYTKIEWEYAIDFERANPMVNGLGMALGLTNEQIDAIWILGATI